MPLPYLGDATTPCPSHLQNQILASASFNFFPQKHRYASANQVKGMMPLRGYWGQSPQGLSIACGYCIMHARKADTFAAVLPLNHF